MRRSEDLSRDDVGKMFYKLCHAISATKNPEAAATLLQDILSYPESEMIAKRLMIAELLMKGDTYAEISEQLKASPGTVSRVGEWLERSGEGYRQAVKASKNVTMPDQAAASSQRSLSEIKRRYPMYYWPEILLEDIINNSSQRQQKRMKSIMASLDKSEQKTDLFQKITKLLR